MTPDAADWTAALDALEEWARRSAATGLDDTAAGDPPALPTGQVPVALRARAIALLGSLQGAEAALLRRRGQLARERAYSA